MVQRYDYEANSITEDGEGDLCMYKDYERLEAGVKDFLTGFLDAGSDHPEWLQAQIRLFIKDNLK